MFKKMQTKESKIKKSEQDASFKSNAEMSEIFENTAVSLTPEAPKIRAKKRNIFLLPSKLSQKPVAIIKHLSIPKTSRSFFIRSRQSPLFFSNPLPGPIIRIKEQEALAPFSKLTNRKTKEKSLHEILVELLQKSVMNYLRKEAEAQALKASYSREYKSKNFKKYQR